MFNIEFVQKYMLTAKLFGELKNPCYSRKIGVVIVNNLLTKVVSMGYNGPPRNAQNILKQFFFLSLQKKINTK
jgi:deoxycytidylate deaminase